MGKNTKLYIGIGIASIVLLFGFYLYYFTPETMFGIPIFNPVEDTNILLVGLDDRESVAKGEVNSDSIILVQFKAEDRSIICQAIPSSIKVNNKALHKFSIEKLPERIEELTGIEPEYYFAVGYRAFEKIIDELGGIEITLDKPLRIPDLELNLQQGKNILSGKEALNYARWFDYTKSEIDRIERQQKLMGSIIDKTLDSDNLLDIPRLYSTMVETWKSIETNMDKEVLSNLVDYFTKKDDLKIDYDIIKE